MTSFTNLPMANRARLTCSRLSGVECSGTHGVAGNFLHGGDHLDIALQSGLLFHGATMLEYSPFGIAQCSVACFGALPPTGALPIL
ncbi:hypothetical protein [Pseudomonas putida]